MNHTFELIPLTIETRGEVIASNVDEFREMIRAGLTNINRVLKTDEEFGQAELDVKALKGAEDLVKSAKEKALADAEQLNALFRALDETGEEIRSPRLELEKLIAARKEEVKAELITEYMGKLDCAARLRFPTFGRSVGDAVKGKRTLDSMRKALEVTVKTHNAMIEKSRTAIASFVRAHGSEIVMDREDLEVKSLDIVEAELRRRFEAKRAAEEQKRLQEEAAKAKAEIAAMKQEAAAPDRPAAPANVVPMVPPKPPKIGGIPTGSKAPAVTADAEWETFAKKVMEAFVPLRAAREGLTIQANKDRAEAFAQAVGAAWGIANKKEVEK
jgi:hypothetical protein